VTGTQDEKYFIEKLKTRGLILNAMDCGSAMFDWSLTQIFTYFFIFFFSCFRVKNIFPIQAFPG